MRLKKLFLENFRNHRAMELDFDAAEAVTYLVGPNAAGKTNILEAIYLLALIKSFRTQNQADLIQWGEEFCRITGEFVIEDAAGDFKESANDALNDDGPESAPKQAHSLRSCVLEVFYGRPPHQQKSLKKNKVKVNAENFIGSCQIVFFHPEDLNMLYLGPDLRRRYLDILNLQINKKYYRALRKYRQVLKQRNALIKAIKEGYAQKADMAVWDFQLAENGSVLTAERVKTVKFLNARLQDFYRGIAQSEDKIHINYKCSLLDASRKEQLPEGFSELKNLYAAALEAARKTDFQAEVTTVGPHRDDLEFFLNDRPLFTHASRGEYRSLLLSLKLLELEFFRTISGRKPILLLDDVFSELDLDRQKMLLEAINEHQTIITASHLDEAISQRAHRSLNTGSSLKVQVLAGKNSG